MNNRIVLGLLGLLFAAPAHSQGQDSTPFERDLQVIATLLDGGFDNANQSYFDRRGGREIRHRRLHVDVGKVDLPPFGEHVFLANGYWDNDEDRQATRELWSLSADHEANAVRMAVWALVESDVQLGNLDKEALEARDSCNLHWRREAAQFRATGKDCGDALPNEMVLSEKQLWITSGGWKGGDFKLHRVRNFECYADIPGVGGGRAEPYDRYEGFRIHDQGGQLWFTSKEGRRLGISLFLVDWPINNYVGIFTRDSFVIYVSEEVDGERRELGYAFTVPEADRIGINLKWMLASCFAKSNRFATPYM